eukprot:Plantae.Rhodophyta-Palmaria_palmata.ctg18673.p2 GENE.Plantae.Rhodophyta-Palmaria_palmata.ctg18673~~Plantae.Rhodophyta-Palmaria_palmata.ctg18673.p2  ORF type:complete len:107 (-),score=17.38 Plantae.Rhodophyta-Palmaria_palmata.ctg18673:29-349(-)
MKAPQAAGVIHGDFERGFIRAETLSYDDLVAAGSEKAAKEKGRMRSEGKDYVVQEACLAHRCVGRTTLEECCLWRGHAAVTLRLDARCGIWYVKRRFGLSFWEAVL